MAAGGVWLYLRRQPPQPLKVFVLSGLPGHAWIPSFSPDGQYVAFAWNGAKPDDDTWVQAVGEGAPFQITSEAAREFSPVWSPVGNRIAFLREKPQTSEIVVAPFPKGSEQVVGTSSILNPFLSGASLRTAIGISWWPDGKHLLFVDRQPPDKIPGVFPLSIETGQKRRMTTPRPGVEVDGLAIPSPDGRTIAFLRGGSPWAFDLYMLPVEPDGTPRGVSARLTHDGVWVEGFDWPADGRSLLFSSVRLGTRRLWRVPSGGGDPEPLPVGGDSAFLPAVARQGNRLAYARLLPESTIWRIEFDAAGRGSPAPLIQSTRKDKHPDPSPGGRLIFTSLRSGTQEFWVSRTDGSEAARISSFDSAPASFPKWSPDATQIAFHGAGGEDGLWHVYLMSSRGGKARRLTQGRHHEVFPSWSTDGKWVYFSSYAGTARWLSKAAADGSGKLIRLTREGCDAFQAVEAADGKWVYFAGHDTPGIWRVPAGGGPEERVLERGSPGHWALFDHGVYHLNLSSPSRPIVEWQALGEPQAKPVAVLPGHAWNYRGAEAGLVVSRDGRRLYLTGSDDGQGEIMIVENFQ